jgi:phosphate transport system substrate-binding protein
MVAQEVAMQAMARSNVNSKPIGLGGLALAAALSLAMGAGAQEPAKPAGNNTRIVVDGSTTVGPLAKAFRDYLREINKDMEISVSESGSGNGAKALLNGTCDVADMSRFMTDAEFKGAIDKGVFPVAHAIALDGLALIVHPSNPAANLTLAQVRGIYAGKLGNWKDVGGPDLKIVKISRDTNSGTYETFAHMVMQNEKIAADAEYVGSNGQAQQRVKSTPAAISFVGLGFAGRGVKTVAVEGVKPGRETVASGQYTLVRPLFMFTNGYPRIGTPLYHFVTFYLTPKGQELIDSLGFVPVTQYPLTQDKDAAEDKVQE